MEWCLTSEPLQTRADCQSTSRFRLDQGRSSWAPPSSSSRPPPPTTRSCRCSSSQTSVQSHTGAAASQSQFLATSDIQMRCWSCKRMSSQTMVTVLTVCAVVTVLSQYNQGGEGDKSDSSAASSQNIDVRPFTSSSLLQIGLFWRTRIQLNWTVEQTQIHLKTAQFVTAVCSASSLVRLTGRMPLISVTTIDIFRWRICNSECRPIPLLRS